LTGHNGKRNNPIREIDFDHKFCGEIDISFGFYLEEIVRGILLT